MTNMAFRLLLCLVKEDGHQYFVNEGFSQGGTIYWTASPAYGQLKEEMNKIIQAGRSIPHPQELDSEYGISKHLVKELLEEGFIQGRGTLGVHKVWEVTRQGVGQARNYRLRNVSEIIDLRTNQVVVPDLQSDTFRLEASIQDPADTLFDPRE